MAPKPTKLVGGGGVTDTSLVDRADRVLPPPKSYAHEYGRDEQQPFISNVVLWLLLGSLYVLAFSSRLFAVVRYESVIHEFDPYFNYRTTQQLTSRGWYEFYNWFDDTVWYPLGRAVGYTVYPGLMMTSGVVYQLLHWLHFHIEIRNVCVFLAPIFAGNTALVTYFFTKEIRGKAAGLCAAALISIIPGYVSRSVAGSYDNEAIAIFAIVATFYTWIKAVNTGSLLWSFWNVLAYFYMVNSWGGYVFIVNLIPLYVIVMIATRRYSHRLYIAYSNFWVIGSMLAMQVQFVGFKGILAGEHFPAGVVFVGLQIYNLLTYCSSLMDKKDFYKFLRIVGIGGAVFLVVGSLSGLVQPFTGRFYVLLDPTYAANNIPIIASVSEHQPTGWSSFFFDLNIILFLVPSGMYLCFRDLTDTSLFILLYGVIAGYFAGIMVRLVLVFTPAACVLGGIAISDLLRTYCDQLRTCLSFGEEAQSVEDSPKKKDKKEKKDKKDKDEDEDASKEEEVVVVKEKKHQQLNGAQRLLGIVSSLAVLFIMYACFVVFVYHCLWVTAEAYSSPSIVLMTRNHDGSPHIIDDYREAYRWLSQNTARDAKIMSWWDYGYQMSAMANRTTLVDNNTWNNTHIATVGRAMASTEEEAIKVMRRLDVTHVLVIFGGRLGYSSDDINKFLWMVKISAGVYPEHVQEKNFYGADGQYRVDNQASKTMLNSMMYKMCYYRFGEVATSYGHPGGFDRVRNTEIGKKKFSLKHLEEAFTSENWIVRIYKVKPPSNRVAGP